MANINHDDDRDFTKSPPRCDHCSVATASGTTNFSPPIEKQLLSRDEVEAEFGVTRRYLELAAWRGDGPPFVKLGRRTVRYRRADILAFIDAMTVGQD